MMLTWHQSYSTSASGTPTCYCLLFTILRVPRDNTLIRIFINYVSSLKLTFNVVIVMINVIVFMFFKKKKGKKIIVIST